MDPTALAAEAQTRPATLSWTCPRRSPPSNAARPSSQLKINGELVILGADGRLSFDALQQGLVTSAAKARAKAAELPASFAAFDLLAACGVDLRTQRWAVRRERLEQVSRGWVPPLQLTPVTADVDEATEWFEVLPAAMGVEGLVVKDAASRYTPGRRDAWVKVKHRETREVIVGGVLGSISDPEVVIGGLYTTDGELVVVGRTVALKPDQAAQLAAALTAARPVTLGRTRSPPTGGAARTRRSRSSRSNRSSWPRSPPMPRPKPARLGTGCATCGCAPTFGPRTCRGFRAGLAAADRAWIVEAWR
ncbi:hypothetical protein ACFPJ1_16955 [Kribbella qitaiheensis]|uniref:ATP-dependent DNA ligase n=1 Tax=Kribbella qitaiheensis TaxID=1544730 RepID=UPI00361F26B8